VLPEEAPVVPLELLLPPQPEAPRTRAIAHIGTNLTATA